ncbi:Purine nucleoside phosphorylase [uncultured archaeon]|nr:Purine nucleoside phosphorylase [uncultured archaeon]
MYPKFKNKHLEEALFNPKDYINYKKYSKNLPKKYILVYQKKILEDFKKKYNPKKIELYSLLTIYLYKDIGIVRMTGIGSPNAVTVMEELIALGGKTFLNIGAAGGLQNEGIFLCKSALRDEGTSYHYLPHGDFIYPDKNLTKKLGESLSKKGLKYSDGITWTIDAPYRETRAEINHYRKKGICTVEMEASALFAVARLRKVKIASAFVVSDLLVKEWEPKFHTINLKKTLNNLLDSAIDCLK